MFIKAFVLSIFFVMLSGCAGVKFANQTVDGALPNDYTTRTRISNSADFRFNMEQNIGAILEEDPLKPGQYRLAATSVILPAGFSAKEELLAKEDNQIYTSTITQGGTATGNYATIGLSLNVDQAATISIFDVSRAEIPTGNIPVGMLITYAKTKPNVKQYWIKSLLLSRILKQVYEKEDASASGSGPAFGAKGTVYHTTSSQQSDYNLAAVLIDLDTYKNLSVGGPVAASTPVVLWSDKMLGIVRLAPICAQPKNTDGKAGTANCK